MLDIVLLKNFIVDSENVEACQIQKLAVEKQEMKYLLFNTCQNVMDIHTLNIFFSFILVCSDLHFCIQTIPFKKTIHYNLIRLMRSSLS